MRSTLPLLLLTAVLCLAHSQRCPPRGETKRANPRNDCGYIKCHNGSGQWCKCPDGHYFVEQKQCCVPRRSRGSSGQSNSKPSSSGGSQRKKPQGSGGGGGGGGSSGGGGSGGSGSDYHW